MDSQPPRFDDLRWLRRPLLLDQIIAETLALGFDMGSEPFTGELLRTLAASKPNGRFLELGTGTGLATTWLLDGMDSGSQLTSVDTDASVQEIARTFLGSDKRLNLVLEDGLDFLRNAEREIYDFVFADAMPGKYEGLEDCLRVVKPGGFYVIDDMLPQPNWPAGHPEKIPVLMDQLANDPRLAIAPMSWATGLVIAVKR